MFSILGSKTFFFGSKLKRFTGILWGLRHFGEKIIFFLPSPRINTLQHLIRNRFDGLIKAGRIDFRLDRGIVCVMQSGRWNAINPRRNLIRMRDARTRVRCRWWFPNSISCERQHFSTSHCLADNNYEQDGKRIIRANFPVITLRVACWTELREHRPLDFEGKRVFLIMTRTGWCTSATCLAEEAWELWSSNWKLQSFFAAFLGAIKLLEERQCLDRMKERERKD